MRNRAHRCLIAVVAIVGSILYLSPGTAMATIVATAPMAVKIAPPPSVEQGELESNEVLFVFDERQNVVLSEDIAVDITDPGTYDDSSDLTPGTIPARTLVSSHFAHADPVPDGGCRERRNIEGTLTTSSPILGIAILAPALDDSDAPLGAPGTIYPTGEGVRRFNLDGQNDFIIEQVDRMTVVIHADVCAHFDQVRIITEGEQFTPTVVTEVHNAAHEDITGTTVPAGTVIHDEATVSGSGPTPTGTVDFARFDNSSCSGTPESVENDVALTNGTAESQNFTTTQGGVSYLVHYDGDAFYVPADGPCEPLNVEQLGGEGCTPGYWKQKQYFDSWVGFTPTQSFEAVLGQDAYPGMPTLLKVLGMNGGGLQALGRHSVAALLNATNPDVDYPFTSSEVIAKFQAAFDSGNAATIEATKNEFDRASNGGCTLN